MRSTIGFSRPVRAGGIGVAVACLLAAAVGSAPAEASFTVAKDDRAKTQTQRPAAPAGDRRGKKRKAPPKPSAPPEPPVAVAPEPPAPPPPPAPRPSWPAPAGWTVTQASTVCTLQRQAGDDGGAIRMIDWKPREPTAAEIAAGQVPPSRAELQIDLEAPPKPGRNGTPPALTLEIGKARFALQPRGPQAVGAPMTPELRAAIDAGGKARLVLNRKAVARFGIAEGGAALAAFDACMENARRQPLPVSPAVAAQ